jgi:hypothetical protein
MFINPSAQPRSFFTGNRVPYTGEQLREIRKRKGVGRPPAVTLQRQENAVMCRVCGGRHVMGSGTGYEIFAWTFDDGIRMARHHFCRKPSPNLAEWERKPRRKDKAAA